MPDPFHRRVQNAILLLLLKIWPKGSKKEHSSEGVQIQRNFPQIRR